MWRGTRKDRSTKNLWSYLGSNWGYLNGRRVLYPLRCALRASISNLSCHFSVPDFRSRVQGTRQEFQRNQAEDLNLLQVQAHRSQRAGPVAPLWSCYLFYTGTWNLWYNIINLVTTNGPESLGKHNRHLVSSVWLLANDIWWFPTLFLVKMKCTRRTLGKNQQPSATVF